MSDNLTRNEETRAAVRDIVGVEDVALTRITSVDVIRLTTNLSGQSTTTYIAHDGPVAEAVLSTVSSPWADQLPSAETMDQVLAQADAMEGVDNVRLHPVKDGYLPTVTMLAAGIGDIKLDILPENPGWTLERALRQLRRTRTQDAEGRTLSRLGAMSLALLAKDATDLNTLVDTVFTGGTILYRGIDCKLAPGAKLVTCLQIGVTRIRSDGIEIGNLPDTVKIAIRGKAYKDRPLSDLVDIAGFESLRIEKIEARSRATRLTQGGTGWIRIDVRDVHGATFEELEREDARAEAQATLERRQAIVSAAQ